MHACRFCPTSSDDSCWFAYSQVVTTMAPKQAKNNEVGGYPVRLPSHPPLSTHRTLLCPPIAQTLKGHLFVEIFIKTLEKIANDMKIYTPVKTPNDAVMELLEWKFSEKDSQKLPKWQPVKVRCSLGDVSHQFC